MARAARDLPPLTLEYVLSIRGCWSVEQVMERAQHWPDPLTWTWLLGPRTEEYSRFDVLAIFELAIAHISRQKIHADVLGGRAGMLKAAAHQLDTKPALHDFIAAIGRRLDKYAAERELEAESRAVVRDVESADFKPEIKIDDGAKPEL